MKRLFVILFAFISFFSFSQNSSKETEKKNAIGFFASPAAYTRWYTGSQYNSEYPRPSTLIFLSPTGIEYQYILNNAVKIHVGVFSTLENESFTDLPGGGYGILKSIDYKLNYLNIPLSFRFFPAHFGASETLGGFFIQVGANFDFVSQEHIISTHYSYHDHHFSSSSYPPGYVDQNYKVEESNSSKIRFNRICSTLSLGHEVVGDKFTFFYGSSIQFASFYQEHNTLEYLRNGKFSLINVGLSYRL